VHRLRNVGLAALGRNRQRGQANRPGSFREGLEFLQRRPEPGNGLVFGVIDWRRLYSMLSYLTTTCKGGGVRAGFGGNTTPFTTFP